jgi:hypothetical protein
VEIAARELSPQNQAYFILEIYDPFGDITAANNAQVAWLSSFPQRNLDWKMFKYKRYNYFLKALDSSGKVRVLI